MFRVLSLAALLLAVPAVPAQAQIVSNPVLTSWTPYATSASYTVRSPVTPSACCAPARAPVACYAPAPAPVATCNSCVQPAVVTARVVQRPVVYYAPRTVYRVPVTTYYAPTVTYRMPTTTVYRPTGAYVATPTTTYYAPSTPVVSAPVYSAPAATSSGCGCSR